MATAGWYPDPSGQQGSFRYWDGAAWGEETSTTPFGPPPGAALDQPTIVPGPGGGGEPPLLPPTARPGHGTYGQTPDSGWNLPAAPAAPPPSYGGPGQHPSAQHPSAQQPWTPQPSATKRSGSGNGATAILVAGAVVFVLLLAVGVFFGVRAVNGDDPEADVAQTPPASVPTGVPTDGVPTDGVPTDVPTAPATPVEPTGLQCTGGIPSLDKATQSAPRFVGGGLSMPPVPGYLAGEDTDAYESFTFADGVTAPSMLVEEGWTSVYAIGSLSKVNGFDDVATAAQVVTTCMTQSPLFYSNVTGVTQLAAEAVTVDGAPGFALTSEIRNDDPEVTVKGDVAKVVVVDTGDTERLGLFVSVVPIGDQTLIDEQAETAADLALE